MSNTPQTHEDRRLPRDVGAAVAPRARSVHTSWLVGLAVAVLWGLLYAFLAATK